MLVVNALFVFVIVIHSLGCPVLETSVPWPYVVIWNGQSADKTDRQTQKKVRSIGLLNSADRSYQNLCTVEELKFCGQSGLSPCKVWKLQYSSSTLHGTVDQVTYRDQSDWPKFDKSVLVSWLTLPHYYGRSRNRRFRLRTRKSFRDNEIISRFYFQSLGLWKPTGGRRRGRCLQSSL
jgi:hypothetical protein